MLAGIALLAALLQPSPLSLRFEASYLQPTSTDVARGLGAGLGASYRLTDQISVVASASQNVVWTRNGQPAGTQRISRSLGIGLVVRTYAAFDPEAGNDTLAGLEGVLRLVFTPGAK